MYLRLKLIMIDLVMFVFKFVDIFLFCVFIGCGNYFDFDYIKVNLKVLEKFKCRLGYVIRLLSFEWSFWIIVVVFLLLDKCNFVKVVLFLVLLVRMLILW